MRVGGAGGLPAFLTLVGQKAAEQGGRHDPADEFAFLQPVERGVQRFRQPLDSAVRAGGQVPAAGRGERFAVFDAVQSRVDE